MQTEWEIVSRPFLKALKSENPASEFSDLMNSLKEQGCSQSYIYDLFLAFLGHCIDQHIEDDDSVALDNLRDSMDSIVGWCHKSCWLFPNKPYYSPRCQIGMSVQDLQQQFNSEPDVKGLRGLDICLFGLREFHLKEGQVDYIHHRGREDGNWLPVGITVKEFERNDF